MLATLIDLRFNHFKAVAALCGAFFLSSLSGAEEQKTLVGSGVLEITPVFSRLSPEDAEWGFLLNSFASKLPKSLDTHGPGGYNCPITSVNYLFITEDGERHSLALKNTLAFDEKKRAHAMNTSEPLFWVGSRWVQRLNEAGDISYSGWARGGQVWNQPLPNLKRAGKHRLIISGTLHHTSQTGPDVTFKSNEAVWFVDPTCVPLSALKRQSRQAIQADIGHPAASITWELSEAPNGDRIVIGAVAAVDLPANRRPRDGNDCYEFTFSPAGELLSQKNPKWVE